MEAIGVALVVAGLLVAVVGGIMIMVKAFQTSLAWGLLCLLVPITILVFIFMHWPEARKGFLISLGGAGILILAGVLGAVTAEPGQGYCEPPVDTKSAPP